jgi:23S rRNA G2445 N2-methylase RlmL
MNLLYRSYLYRKFIDYDPSEEERAAPVVGVLPGFDSFFGNDINSVHLRGCLKNISSAGVHNVEVRLGDSTKTLLEPRADAVVTNPPYGVRGSKLNRATMLYQRFLANLPNVLKAEGKAVVVTSDSDELRQQLASKGMKPDVTAKTLHGHLWVEGISFRLQHS